MYFETLSKFIFWLPSVAAFNPFSALANQQPLSHQTDISNLPTLIPIPGSLMYCGDPAHWECTYLYLEWEGIWCRCVVDVFQDGGWQKKENATRLEVWSELQPGNNETLHKSFEVQCEEKNAAGCLSWQGGEFVCGCHQRQSNSQEDEMKGDLDLGDRQKKGVDRDKNEEEHDFGDSQFSEGGFFRFHRFRLPHCSKPGYHIKCCSYEGKSQCFCAGNGARC